MGDFKRGGQNFGGNRDKKRGFSGGGGRNGGRPDMHKAVCTECGKDCEVPFRPTGAKPVFCSDCFSKQGGGNAKDRGPKKFGDRNSRPNFNSKSPYQNNSNVSTESYKVQFEQLNSKLDKVLELVATLAPKEVKKITSSDKKTVAKKAPVKPKAKKAVKKTAAKKKK